MTEQTVAIVTGSARGIGFAIARHLIDHGMTVAIADIATDAAQSAARRLGEQAFPVDLDVTSPENWDQAVGTIEEQRGPVAVLVNCAGITGRSVPVWELSVEE